MQSPGTEQLPCSSLQPRLQIAREEKIENWDQNQNISNHLFCAWIANDCISRIKNCFVKFQTFFTISAFPSTQANLVSAFTASIMAKLIVTWPTKCRTRGVEIIFRALHTNATQKNREMKNQINCRVQKIKIIAALSPRARPSNVMFAVAAVQQKVTQITAMDGARTKFTLVHLHDFIDRGIWWREEKKRTYRYVIRAFLPI